MIVSMDDSLLNPLKEALEVDLNWDPSGQCCLDFEGGIEITLSLHSNYISIRSLLGEGLDHLLRTTLSAQYKDPKPAYFLALDDKSNLLFLVTLLNRENIEFLNDVVYELLSLTQEYLSLNSLAIPNTNSTQSTQDFPTTMSSMRA
jgi:hypothetical protein